MKTKRIHVYLWLLSYFRPYLWLTGIYILCGGGIVFGEILFPRRMGYMIDHIKNGTNFLFLQISFLAVLIVGLVLMKVCYHALEQNISYKTTRDQKIDLMKHLQALGLSYYEKEPTGRILSLFENSVAETQQTYTFLIPQFVYNMAQFLVPSILLLIYEPIFFVISMIGNILYIFFNHMTNQKIQFYMARETKAASVSWQSFYDALTSAKEVTTMGREHWVIHQTLQKSRSFYNETIGAIFWRHFRYTTVGFTLTISTLLFYITGLSFIQKGQLTIGAFVGYSFFMGLMSRGFSVFFYIIPAQQHAVNYAQELYDFLQQEPSVSNEKMKRFVRRDENEANPSSNPSPDLIFSNVSFSYNPKHRVLKHITCTIPFGKKVAFVGESGCGKSTLIKLIDRFYDVTEGNIVIGNQEIKEMDIEYLREMIFYGFQDTFLFQMSVMENIRFVKPNASDKEVIKAAKKACADEFIQNLPEGYQTILGGREGLSGGEKQRISLARMFLKNAPITILDEATSALDTITEEKIRKEIEQNYQDKTLISIAHRISSIQNYDEIYMMEKGSIKEHGTYQELMEQKGAFYKMVTRRKDK